MDKHEAMEGLLLDRWWQLCKELERVRLDLKHYNIQATISQQYPQAPIAGSVVKHIPEPKEAQ